MTGATFIEWLMDKLKFSIEDALKFAQVASSAEYIVSPTATPNAFDRAGHYRFKVTASFVDVSIHV